MLIKNLAQLATTPLRRAALEIAEAALEAIDTKKVIRTHVKLDSNTLKINDTQYDLLQFEHIYVVAIGKCALAASQALEEVLGEKIDQGFCLDVQTGPLKKIVSLLGTHPLPSQENVDHTK